MSGERKQTSDLVIRCAIHPQFKGTGDVFDHAWLLYFVGKGAKRSLSVGWREFLATEADAHAYGCRSAAISNAGKLQRKGVEPRPLEDKAHYLGFYELSITEAKTASNDVYDVSFEHVPEHGEEAHGHIFYEERPGLDNNVNKGVARTDIVDKLWRLMSGPTRHVCEVDKAYKVELEAIVLNSPPPRAIKVPAGA